VLACTGCRSAGSATAGVLHGDAQRAGPHRVALRPRGPPPPDVAPVAPRAPGTSLQPRLCCVMRAPASVDVSEATYCSEAHASRVSGAAQSQQARAPRAPTVTAYRRSRTYAVIPAASNATRSQVRATKPDDPQRHHQQAEALPTIHTCRACPCALAEVTPALLPRHDTWHGDETLRRATH
jgi:hypothetical protein